MNNIKITLWIEPHLKKFLAYDNKLDPFKLSNSSKCYLSAIIMQKLERSALPDIKEYDGIDELFEVELNNTVMNEKKFTVTAQTVLHFNRTIDALFQKQLNESMTIQRKKIGDVFLYIPEFCALYGISEDDMKFETLVKRYYRWRNPPEPKVTHDGLAGVQPELFGGI